MDRQRRCGGAAAEAREAREAPTASPAPESRAEGHAQGAGLSRQHVPRQPARGADRRAPDQARPDAHAHRRAGPLRGVDRAHRGGVVAGADAAGAAARAGAGCA